MTPFTWPQVAVEAATLALYNRYRRRCGLNPVDYIGANKTGACEQCRTDAQAALSAAVEAMAKADMAREGYGVMDGSGPEWEVLSGDGLRRGGFPVLILKSGPGEKGEA